jgi:acetoin utilization protein AcuB
MFGWMGGKGKEPKPFRRKETEVIKNPLAGIVEKSRAKADEIAGRANAEEGRAVTDAGKAGLDCGEWPVSRVMSAKVAAVFPDDTLLTVREVFAKVKFRHLAVVDEAQKVLGVVSDRDVLRAVSPFFGTVNEQTRDLALMRRPVHQIMTREPICAAPDLRIEEAIRIMRQKRISCLPVVDGEFRIIGILTWKDIVRAFCPQGFHAPQEKAPNTTGIRRRAGTGSGRIETSNPPPAGGGTPKTKGG